MFFYSCFYKIPCLFFFAIGSGENRFKNPAAPQTAFKKAYEKKAVVGAGFEPALVDLVFRRPIPAYTINGFTNLPIPPIF
jgi:hypothetical protein